MRRMQAVVAEPRVQFACASLIEPLIGFPRPCDQTIREVLLASNSGLALDVAGSDKALYDCTLQFGAGKWRWPYRELVCPAGFVSLLAHVLERKGLSDRKTDDENRRSEPRRDGDAHEQRDQKEHAACRTYHDRPPVPPHVLGVLAEHDASLKRGLRATNEQAAGLIALWTSCWSVESKLASYGYPIPKHTALAIAAARAQLGAASFRRRLCSDRQRAQKPMWPGRC